jgi:hypothetical protein
VEKRKAKSEKRKAKSEKRETGNGRRLSRIKKIMTAKERKETQKKFFFLNGLCDLCGD